MAADDKINTDRERSAGEDQSQAAKNDKPQHGFVPVEEIDLEWNRKSKTKRVKSREWLETPPDDPDDDDA